MENIVELNEREFAVVFDEHGNVTQLYIPEGVDIVPQVMIDIAVNYMGVDASEFETPTVLH